MGCSCWPADRGGCARPLGAAGADLRHWRGHRDELPGLGGRNQELVPREDLVRAIALNGIGFNLARALGPAIGGFALAAAGPAAAFALNAVAFLVLIVALVSWRRPAASRAGALPKEHLPRRHARGPSLRLGRPGDARGDPAGLRLLLLRLGGLGPAAAGRARAARAGAAGLRADAGRDGRRRRGGRRRAAAAARRGSARVAVFWASLLACAAMALLGLAAHWALAGVAMLLYGAAWLAAGSTLQVSAQLAAPGWVRARALGVYQLCFFGALALGAVVWGWVGAAFGRAPGPRPLRRSGAVAAVAVRRWRLDGSPSPQRGRSRTPSPPLRCRGPRPRRRTDRAAA